ncbi:MAG TPA: hypothetical protein VGR08_07210 [Thermomicrobiales bacterium]|nr:hypothetical protein [Thermomicrobiales bacterium]
MGSQPRPQAQPGASGGPPPGGGTGGDGYGEGDPGTFIAPARTDYDYSPLDLAPPGQRRRRQFVAAAVGGLSVLLLGAIAVFGYLLLRDEPANDDDNDVIAAQTELAASRATIAAQETIVAQAAAEQTALVQGPAATPPEATAPPADEGGAETPAAGATRPPEETPADAAGGTGAALSPDELSTLLPAEDTAPAGLDSSADSSRDQAGVVEALGGGRPAEQNLETWGWTGNVERTFSASDPESLEPGATSYLVVSIHGFGTPRAAAEALPFFSDILVNSAGYDEVEAPDIGDRARMLQVTGEDGITNVALYVQDGTVLYRIGGAAPDGDPTEDVVEAATNLVES